MNGTSTGLRDVLPGKYIVALLCVWAVVSVLAFGGVDSLALGAFGILSAIAVIMWAAEALRRGELVFSANVIQLPILGLIFIACVQLLPLGGPNLPDELLPVNAPASLSLDPYSTRIFLIRLVIYAIFFGAALAFIRGGRIKKIAVTLIVFGSAVAFFAILQRLANLDAIYGIRPSPQAIPLGPYINQHHFAGLMEMISGLAFGLLFGRALGRDKKLLVGIGAAVMGIAILFTGSRGGLISYAAVVIFAASASFAAGRKKAGRQGPKEGSLRNIIILAAGLFAAFIIVGSAFYLGGGEGLFRGIGDSTDITSGRTHFWRVAWQIFSENPLLGAGFDAFGVAFSRFDTWNGIFRVEQAHNDYLQMLSDGGVLALLCVAAFIVILFRQGARNIVSSTNIERDIAVGALAGCAGILIHSFFDFPLRTPANAFIFLILAVLSVASLEAVRSGGKLESDLTI